MKQMKKYGESRDDEEQNPRRQKNNFLTLCHYDVVKTYLCYHKDGFKVKVAALQI